jgi:hypothetical protein
VSDGLTCDGCGAPLLLDAEVRYVLDVRGYAAYDPLEITRADLDRDLDAEMRHTLEDLRERDPRALEEEVHNEFRFDLCPRCWKRFLRNPLGGLGGVEKSQGN